MRVVPLPDRDKGANPDTEMTDASEVKGATSVPDHDMGHQKHTESTSTPSQGAGRSEEGASLRYPIDDSNKRFRELLAEICKFPEGLAMVQREWKRSLRAQGVDVSSDPANVSDDSTSDEASRSDGADRFASPDPITPAKRAGDLDAQDLNISPKKVKRWFETL